MPRSIIDTRCKPPRMGLAITLWAPEFERLVSRQQAAELDRVCRAVSAHGPCQARPAGAGIELLPRLEQRGCSSNRCPGDEGQDLHPVDDGSVDPCPAPVEELDIILGGVVRRSLRHSL